MRRITILTLLSFAVSALPAHNLRAAQETPTVDTVLAKAVEALGGKAALEKPKSRFMKGEMELPAMALKGTWEVTAKAPNKQVTRADFAGTSTTEGFDGKMAWSKGPDGSVREKSGDELAKAKRDAEFYRELKVKTLYPDLAYKGSEQFEGDTVDVLESHPSATSSERFSFSRKTGLLVRQQSQVETGQGAVKVDLKLMEYKPYDGVQSPRKLAGRVTVAGQEMEFNINITELKHNEPVEDAKFEKPQA